MTRFQRAGIRIKYAVAWIRSVIAASDCFLFGHEWWPEYEMWKHYYPDPIARCIHCGAKSYTPAEHFRVTAGK